MIFARNKMHKIKVTNCQTQLLYLQQGKLILTACLVGRRKQPITTLKQPNS